MIDFGTHTLRDGSIFLHASTVELVPQGSTTFSHTAWLSRPGIPFWTRSRDDGGTWEYGGRIAEDAVAHFSEPAIYRTPGGRILVLLRCHPRQPHDTQCRLALVTSDDAGAT